MRPIMDGILNRYYGVTVRIFGLFFMLRTNTNISTGSKLIKLVLSVCECTVKKLSLDP
jgi:hypothetical protein